MSPPSRHPELAAFIEAHALQRGRFTLASGQTSDHYIDGRLISFDPKGSWLMVEAILRELEGVSFDAVGGMDMGATPIVAALANRSHAIGRPIPSFIVRKEAKTHGMAKRIEGPLTKDHRRIVMVDDTITTGGSILRAIDVVEEAGHEVVLALAVVDRGAGAGAILKERGIRYQPLVTLPDLGISA